MLPLLLATAAALTAAPSGAHRAATRHGSKKVRARFAAAATATATATARCCC
jgi:hypothetical protein